MFIGSFVFVFIFFSTCIMYECEYNFMMESFFMILSAFGVMCVVFNLQKHLSFYFWKTNLHHRSVCTITWYTIFVEDEIQKFNRNYSWGYFLFSFLTCLYKKKINLKSLWYNLSSHHHLQSSERNDTKKKKIMTTFFSEAQ